MKTGKVVLLAAACAACAVLIFVVAKSRSVDASSGAKTPQAVAGGEAQPGATTIRRMDAPPQRPGTIQEEVAAAYVEEVRQSLKQKAAAVQAALDESQTSASGDATEQEQKLLDAFADLAKQLRNNAELTTQVVALLKAEQDPEMMRLIAQALGEAAWMLGDKFPTELLLEMASGDDSFARRQAALLALSYLNGITPELQERLAEISRNAPINEIRLSAVACMGSWMNRNRDLTQSISEKLLETREATDDPMLRGLVIQTIGNMDTPLSPKVLEAMAQAVVGESEAINRAQAAVALGSGAGPENREAVLAALNSAYVVEPMLDTQRHIITQIVKASRTTNAEEILGHLPVPHPLLAQDVQDYLEILAATPDRNDWGAIWNQKDQRDIQRGTSPDSHGGN